MLSKKSGNAFFQITTNFNVNIFILYKKHKSLNQRNLDGYWEYFVQAMNL